MITKDGISGSKWHPFGGGGGGGGNDAPNTLHSNTTANFIDLVGAGTIKGLVAGGQSIIIDGTPYQNTNGSTNFTGLSYTFLNGTPDQSYIPGFTAQSMPFSVGVEVKQDTPYTFTVSNDTYDRATVQIQFPAMTSEDSKGNENGNSVSIAIELNGNQVVQDNISGKNEAPYVKSYNVDLSSAIFPAEVKVIRQSGDSDTSTNQNTTYVYSYNLIIDKKFNYPFSAICGIQVDFSQFGGDLPTRQYDVYGQIVQIPSNYDPIASTYDGVWDGTFISDWTDNPIWFLNWVLSDNMNGLGTFLGSGFADKNQAYTVAKYCDQLVPDGRGGQEKRFSINAQFTDAQDANTFLTNLASNFRGMLYYLNGKLFIGCDMPSDPVALYTNSNVVGGIFNYASSGYSNRISSCNVTYNDPENGYQPTVVSFQDPVVFNLIGDRSSNIQAVGCTSAGQAMRLAKLIVWQSNYGAETVSFSVGLSGLLRFPGNVIQIMDSYMLGSRPGGKIQSFVGTTVSLDAPFNFVSGKSYEIQMTQLDGTIFTSKVTNAPGITLTVSTEDESEVGCQPGADYMITTDDLQPTLWMISNIKSDADSMTWAIEATIYNKSKYDYVDKNTPIMPSNGTLFSDFLKSSVQHITVGVNVYPLSTNSIYQISVRWDALEGAYSYEYQYAANNGNPTAIQKTSINSFEFNGQPGNYTFSVRAFDLTGRASQWATYNTQVNSSLIPIDDVTDFVCIRQGDNVNFGWSASESNLLKNYEIRRGTEWATAYLIATPKTTSLTISESEEATFLIKAYTIDGGYSQNAAITTCLPPPSQYVQKTQDEQALEFPGTKTNMVLTEENTLISTESDTCAYETNVIDLEEILTARLTVTLWLQADRDMTLTQFFTLYPTIGSLPSTMTIGGDPNAVTAVFSISTSEDGSTYTPFKTYLSGFSKYRYIKIRIDIARKDGSVLPEITDLSFKFDLLAKQEGQNDYEVSDTGTTYTYSNFYITSPNVKASLQNSEPGDNYKISKSGDFTSVTFNVYDSAGLAKPGFIDFSVTGY